MPRAQHQGLALAEVEGAGSGERELVAEGDDGVDHAQRDAAEDKLQEDFHGIPRKTEDEKMASPDSSRLAIARQTWAGAYLASTTLPSLTSPNTVTSAVIASWLVLLNGLL